MNVYKVTNKVNGKIYIGKDSHDNPSYLGSGKLITRAINKYGKDNFYKEILEICADIQVLNERELFWIINTDCLTPNGYNILIGSTGGDVLSNNPDRNIIIQHMSDAGKKRIGEKNSFFGKHHTLDSIEKIKSKDRYSSHDKVNCMCSACRSSRGDEPIHKPSDKQKEAVRLTGIANKGKLKGEKNPRYIQVDENIKLRIKEMHTSGFNMKEINRSFPELSYNKIIRIIRGENGN
jgi:group I intron endonuclease